MRIRPLFPLLFVLLMAIPIGWSQSASEQKTPTSVIRDKFLRAYNEHDTGAVLAFYADDAVLLSEAGVFRGRDEIRNWLQFAMDQGSVLESITPIREKAWNALAYGTGQTKRLVGKEVHLGRYLLVLEQQSGRWCLVEHASFNVHE